MEREGIGRLAAKLGPDTGAALRRALQSSTKNPTTEPGPAKVLQEWRKARADWDEVIGAACDEEGVYVIREHHWEQPYFDPLSVTADLEPITARMAALLPRVFDQGLDPDFSFADKAAECVDEIASSFPEWLPPFECESFRLGPKATGCLVQWELRVCRREGKSLFQLIDKLRELEQSNPGLDLESGDWLKAFSPTLARVLGHGWSMDTTLLASRRNWLHRLGTAALVPEVQAFWKRNLLRLVPDPASDAGSDYERCVDWLQALREIDPDAARRLLDKWGAAHWRRRNLWNTIRKRGLPVPDLRGRRI